jgi:hypothetical protein
VKEGVIIGFSLRKSFRWGPLSVGMWLFYLLKNNSLKMFIFMYNHCVSF